jgi:hypothetical protein
VHDVVQRAAERLGVKIRGDVSAPSVNVAIASMAHALSIPFDLAAGSLQSARTVEIACTQQGARVVLDITAPNGFSSTANANELLAVASFMFRREDATLACKPNGFVVELPVAQ